MVQAEIIRRRLDALTEHLSVLERLATYSETTFLEEPERYGAAERFLQLSLEAFLDLGNHVIADLGLGPVDKSRDIPAILQQQGYLDAELAETWLRMIGFRNILVHAYLDLDRHQVYEILQHHLDDLRALQAVFAEFL
ncbi:type VII toxin-antitoxin system HepT family RNase toxin [Halorhodospira neutriphila]|uniref:DUF86 domain-containing protein n=1 Tax=Halorhodospira neutriphila TaxID=168379 RepID=A0ABS1E584_9GAMM|nr:hypothetical protein [Halorhodospira neutriphila]